MKILPLSVMTAALFLAFSFDSDVHAVTPSATPLATVSAGNDLTPVLAVPELELLQQAYTLLEMADHDYKGHRMLAMKQIEAAGKLLGGKIAGKGKGHENQGVSDSQLRQAEALLQQAQSAASVGRQAAVLSHIQGALTQITIALSIH